MYEMKNVLITGGLGFIGSHVVDRIKKENKYHLIVVDNMLGSNFHSDPRNFWIFEESNDISIKNFQLLLIRSA